jgi:CIC family chloride channel protein
MSGPKLVILAAAKFVTSSVALGCGAPGGVFGPTFFIGTMAGGAFHRLSMHLIPAVTGPRGSYALIGLGAFLGAVTHAPLTALFLLLEMTHSNSVALPAMVAIVTSTIVARGIETESMDTYRLAREGKTLEIGRERLALTQIPVGAVMSKEVDSVRENTPLTEVMRVAGNTEQSTLPVVGEAGNLAGIIVTRDLLAVISRADDIGPLANAFVVCRKNPPTVTVDSSLDEASQHMERESLDEIAVIDVAHAKFVGLVSRRQIAQALNRVSISISSLATQDQGIYWATGYHVTRAAIPEAANGRTLRELDSRARFGVTVLAIQKRGEVEAGFRPATPDQRLGGGDIMMIAGRPPDIRNFTRELERAPTAKAASS